MRLSLLLIGTAYLSLGLGSAQACSVKFETGTGIASPARFALLWPERDQARVMGRFFVLGSEESTPVQENIPPNAKYCFNWDSSEPLWSNWESNCARPIWPDGKCSGDVKVITHP
jgi:hypothetical protein